MKLGRLWLFSALAGVILAGVMVSRAALQIPEADSIPYHARVKQVESNIEASNAWDFGDWTSTKVDVPSEAQKLLRSNVLISRQYFNKKRNQSVNFLLVQCADARHLSGHFPPVCYPNSGYTSGTSRPSGADINGEGMLYNFSQETLRGTRAITVYNIMVLPDNKTARDMDGIKRIARTRQLRSFGAAEIQVLTDANMPDEDRANVINLLLAHYKPLIDEIRSGVVQ
jgi:hypothetical protein